jgi:hypothetical protein
LKLATGFSWQLTHAAPSSAACALSGAKNWTESPTPIVNMAKDHVDTTNFGNSLFRISFSSPYFPLLSGSEETVKRALPV